MTEYYRAKLQDGNEYSDWISDKLRQANPSIIIGMYASKKYQIEKGESFSGIEIKNDRRLAGDDDGRPTHNLYFEVAEKSCKERTNYVDSGIYRSDNCWLYLTGNYEEAFLFSTKQLIWLYENKKYHDLYGVETKKTDTSMGFIIPRDKVLNSIYLLQHWVFDEEKIKLHHPKQNAL